MCPGDHPLEQLTGEPDGTTPQATVCAEIDTEVIDELWRELRQLDVMDMHPIDKESGNVLPTLLHSSE